MVAAMGMHLSYWTSSLHSRNYRLDQYRLGYAAQFPHVTELISSLNGIGQSELADKLVVAILSHTKPRVEFWSEIQDWFPAPARDQARKEIEERYPASVTA